MASTTTTTTVLLLLTVIFFISTITVTSRPCKTIFFITTTTTTNHPFQNQNPNPNPTRLTFFITEIHHFHRTTSFHPNHHHDVVSSKPYFPSPYSSSSSIRDRTMDIISIVGALLFGIGCGAITAGTIYLIWFLFSNQQLDFDSDDSEDEFDYGDDDVSPRNKNKDGYVAVGNKEVPPSADEVDAMKS